MNHATQIIAVDTHPSTMCMRRMPFIRCPLSAHCQATIPVIKVGRAVIAAPREVVVSTCRKNRPLGSFRKKIKGGANREQSHWEMDRHNMLRMLGQEYRFDVERVYAHLAAHCTITLPVIFG